MAAGVDTTTAAGPSRDLKRSIGFFGLMFISLGSIIGSGWLLGALSAAQAAGPASLISWILAAILLMTLALVHAELGAAYPVAGGTARFPYFAFGTLAGFTAGWAAYLQAVTIAPIEVEAAISYLNSTALGAQRNLHMLHKNGTLNGVGLLIATAAMLLFTVINLLGAKLLSDSNTVMVIWKAAVPVLAVVVIMSLSFHASQLHRRRRLRARSARTASSPRCRPAWCSRCRASSRPCRWAARPATRSKDISRAIISAMFIGAAVYILLEVAFIGGLSPGERRARLEPARSAPATSGLYYTLALAAGAGWLATILLVDAVISPGGTGLIYLGTSARLSYALGEEEVITDKLTADEQARRAGRVRSLLAFVIGEVTFLPFPSWNSLVGLVTGATAIMYAFAPVSLAALQHPRPRPAAPVPRARSPRC